MVFADIIAPKSTEAHSVYTLLLSRFISLFADVEGVIVKPQVSYHSPEWWLIPICDAVNESSIVSNFNDVLGAVWEFAVVGKQEEKLRVWLTEKT